MSPKNMCMKRHGGDVQIPLISNITLICFCLMILPSFATIFRTYFFYYNILLYYALTTAVDDNNFNIWNLLKTNYVLLWFSWIPYSKHKSKFKCILYVYIITYSTYHEQTCWKVNLKSNEYNKTNIVRWDRILMYGW